MTGYGSRPYSSLALRDYDPLSDTLGMDQSRSYLGGRSLSGGAASSLDGHLGHLRDTAISGGLSAVDPYDDRTRFLASRSRFVGDCRAPWQHQRGRYFFFQNKKNEKKFFSAFTFWFYFFIKNKSKTKTSFLFFVFLNVFVPTYTLLCLPGFGRATDKLYMVAQWAKIFKVMCNLGNLQHNVWYLEG